jgi:hypothetical protein
MSIAFPGVVCGIETCDLGEKWPWVFGKRMKSQSVYNETRNLWPMSAPSSIWKDDTHRGEHREAEGPA